MTKKSKSEERFYVIVPDLVTGEGKRGKTYRMESGRLIAQAFHIGRLVENIRKTEDPDLKYQEITCIVLSARNAKEMNKIAHDLRVGIETVNYTSSATVNLFYDTNDEIYGKDCPALTAIAFGPISTYEKECDFDHVIGHLELYDRF